MWSPGSNLSHSDLHSFPTMHSDSPPCQPPSQGTTRPFRRFFSKASSSLSHSHLAIISINSPVVSCLKPGYRRQPRVQIQPRDSGQQSVQLSQMLHCSSLTESAQMGEGREHSCREESLAVVPPISPQATPRCPWI